MLCTNKCTAASYCRSRNNCRSIDIIIIIVVIFILVIIVIVIMKLAISFSKLRLETDEIKLTLRNRFWQLCLLTNNYSSILHFFGNMIFQSIFHAIIALVKYVFWQGSTNCSILPTRWLKTLHLWIKTLYCDQKHSFWPQKDSKHFILRSKIS